MLVQALAVRQNNDVEVARIDGADLLELLVDAVEALRVLGQLVADVLRADEDGLQVGPGALHLQQNLDDLVRLRQLLLPGADLGGEVGDVLGGEHVLQLDLVVLQCLDQLVGGQENDGFGASVLLCSEGR